MRPWVRINVKAHIRQVQEHNTHTIGPDALNSCVCSLRALSEVEKACRRAGRGPFGMLFPEVIKQME